MDDNKIRINLQMNGVDYPLTINRSEEEEVRAAAKRVNQYIRKVRQVFNNKEVGDDKILTITAYQFALLVIRAEKKGDIKPSIDKIKEWNALLEKTLMADFAGTPSSQDIDKDLVGQ